jgi:hypothetical protein
MHNSGSVVVYALLWCLVLWHAAAAAAAASSAAARLLCMLLPLQILPLAYAFLKRKGPANFKPLRT